MLLPRATMLASMKVRQEVGLLLPSTYCSPTCPSCRADVADFVKNTSCVANSDFLTNCGACQQCVISYNIEKDNGLQDATIVLAILTDALKLCENTIVSSEIAALESQASRISLFGNQLTTTANSIATSTSELRITPAPSSSETIPTIAPAPATPIPTSTETTVTAATQPLNNSWVVGPVIGSILGVATVAIVIYFTRRRQRQGPERLPDVYELDKKSMKGEDNTRDSINAKPQLHSNDIKPGELETNEIYELAAPEPAGSELSTPRDDSMTFENKFPLPISPLKAMFVMTELRDERAGNNKSPKHETYYNP